MARRRPHEPPPLSSSQKFAQKMALPLSSQRFAAQCPWCRRKSLLRRKVLREPALRASEENVPAIAQAREYEPAVAQGPQGPESTCCWGASRAWDSARAPCPCLRVGPRRPSPWALVPAHKTRTLDRVQRAPPLRVLERCPRVCVCAMLAARALAECSRCDRVRAALSARSLEADGPPLGRQAELVALGQLGGCYSR